MTRIEVRGYSVLGWTKVLPGIPTPRLIQASGEQGTVEAYFVPSDYVRPDGSTLDGVWYLHDEPRYVAPDGQYTRVRVVAVEEPYPW